MFYGHDLVKSLKNASGQLSGGTVFGYHVSNPKSYGVVEFNNEGTAISIEEKPEAPKSNYAVSGLNAKVPFSTSDTVDHPISLYAASKKANELMSHSYSHLYDIPTTGLRFFTVYGPWGRPDMALFKFTKKMVNGEAIDIYNQGDMRRDFTYIDDIVEGIVRIQNIIPDRTEDWRVESNSASTSSAPYKIYNIGNGSSVKLMDFIEALETSLGIEAVKNFMPMQPGDVYQTYADTEDFFKATGYQPKVGVKEGVAAFVKWYRDFYKV